MGKQDPTQLDGGPTGVTPARRAHAQRYEEALQAYQSAQFDDTARLAEDLLRHRPEDLAAITLLERARTHTQQPVDDTGKQTSEKEGKAEGVVAMSAADDLRGWTGVMAMTDK